MRFVDEREGSPTPADYRRFIANDRRFSQVRSWRLHQHTNRSFADLARTTNPIVRGWMNYYGAFYRSALYPLLQRINA